METGVIKGLDRDPSIQIIPTLGPKVCIFYLRWAIWIPRKVQKYSWLALAHSSGPVRGENADANSYGHAHPN